MLIIAGFYVGWNIGANDAANCIGTAVGSGIVSYKKAIFLVASFSILGALLQGGNVMKTIGKGIVSGHLDHKAIFVALISGGFFVTLATYFKVPVSTSQSIVGSVIGIGVAKFGFDPQNVHFAVFYKKILPSWIISPFLTGTLAFIIYSILLQISKRVKNVMALNRVMAYLVILSAMYVAYSLGTNNVGNAVGPLLQAFPDSKSSIFYLQLLGGSALAIGALTFSRGVVETVGKSITPLDMPGAFAAQTAGAFGIHLFSMLGIPISTSQAVVGAVIGVGLVRGMKAVSGKKIVQIVVGWFATPTGAGLFSWFLYRILFRALGLI